MIQIIAYREFFDRVKNIWDVKHQKYTVEVADVPSLFSSLDAILAKIPKEEHYNLHYTIARCHPTPRLFKEQSTIPFDLDDIDVNELDRYISIIEEITEIPQTDMGITFSGHGLHFLIETTHTIASVEELKALQPAYKAICGRINARLQHDNLPGKADPIILRPAATLRLPGTINRAFSKAKKHDYPDTNAYAINTKVVAHDFKLLTMEGVMETEQLSNDAIRRFPRPDTPFILEECNFLKWNFEKAEEVSEPEWYAALSIIGVLENGRDLAHQMSKGHPSYDYTVTDQKLTQAMEKSGPRTCANVDTLSDKCRSCKHFGSITSPVLLRGPDYIKTLDTGFWNITIDEETGRPKPSTPAFEDLRKFFEKTYRYISLPSGTIYVWKDTHWTELEDIFIRAFVQDNMNPKPRKSHVEEFMALVKRTNVRPETFFDDSTVGRINLRNGVLKLESMELEPHDPRYGFRHRLNHDFDARAACPRFDKFMEEVTLSRNDLRDLLLEYTAYAFSGMPYIHHKALMLTGEGSNGKSTFLSVLKKLAGSDSYSSLMLNELDHEYKRAYMVGKLFNVAEETPVRSLGDSSWFKVLSAGGSYMAREIYKKPVNVVSNRTKLIMACNELPDLNDFSDGFTRRLLIVPFDAKFSLENNNLDPLIEEKLEDELSGIFNRIVEAYHRLIQKRGFTNSEIVKETVQTYREANNTVGMWFKENVSFEPGLEGSPTFLAANSMIRSYVEWCKPMSLRPVSTTKFGLEIKRLTGKNSLQRKISGKNIRGYEGLELKISSDF
jgi:P4 family phage/plasmid primase-like protien